jgi:hypothetical protein
MNHQRQSTCVFPSPSKIPYGGFSPVRLQTEIQPPPSMTRPDLSAARIRPAARLIGGYSPGDQQTRPTKGLAVEGSGAPDPSGTSAGSTGRSRPEALGSPAGYAVPPDPRLLWPHPSLSPSSTHLWIRGWLLQPMGLHRAEGERFPNLLPVSVPSCRPPYPGGPDGCLWLYFTIRAGLRRLCMGSASTDPVPGRFVHGMCNEAARFVSYYGPEVCSPFTDKGFYFRAFTGWITPNRRRE